MIRSRITALLAVLLTAVGPLAVAWFLSQGTGTGSGRVLAAAPEPSGTANVDASAGMHASQYAGVHSCSGLGCHGALQASSSGIKLNESTVWAGEDHHARAYAALTGERGQRIGKNLGVDAAHEVQCLACHVTPQLAKEIAKTPGVHPRANSGVSCEACHGPAAVPGASWLTEHTRQPWKDNKIDKKPYQMVDLADVKVEAATCVGCHVGAPKDPEAGIPERDLNHDLMAAGHPRLTFELTAFLENMPPHWQEKGKDHEARSWAVGQVATAKAAVALLEHRAKHAKDNKAPWPEFAEANCFSCHAGLRVPSWRREGSGKGHGLGTIPYSDWQSFMLPYVTPDSAPTDVASGFAELSEVMNHAYPDEGNVIKACKKLDAPLAALEKQVNAGKYNKDTCRAMLARMRADGAKRPRPLTWDEAEQFTLAVAALGGCAELDEKDMKKLQPALTELWRRELVYPPGRESPGNFRADVVPDDKDRKPLFDTRWKNLIECLPAK